MKFLGNVIWLILGGILGAVLNFIAGCLFYITIIGIPVGKVCFRLSKVYLWPFGKDIKINFDKHPIGNILWLIFFGWESALNSIFFGILLCITIIGIPFGMQHFKLAKLVLLPFGATIKNAK